MKSIQTLESSQKSPILDKQETTRDLSQSNSIVSFNDLDDIHNRKKIFATDLNENKLIRVDKVTYKYNLQLNPCLNSQEIVYLKYLEEISIAKKKIFEAVHNCDLQTIKYMFTIFPISFDIFAQKIFKNNNTILHTGIKILTIQIIEYILQHEKNILNIGNNQNKTLIHFSIIYNKSLLKYIIEKWSKVVDWGFKDKNGNNYYQYCKYYNVELQICEIIKITIQNLWMSQKQQSKKQNWSLIKQKYQIFNSQKSLHKNQKWKNQSKLLKFNSIIRSQILDNSLQIPTFDQFEIISIIGRGGFATVYKVKYIPTGNYYALKTIYKHKLNYQYYQKYVKTEKQILMMCNHPNIIQLYSTFEDNYCLYMLLELCDRGTLKQIIYSNFNMSEKILKIFLCQLVKIIQYLHQKRILYRDFKPENICLGEDGQLRLIDFGLSKKLKYDKSTRSFCGTLQYIAPQITKQQQYSFAVDFYSLGILIYQMLTKSTKAHDKISKQYEKLPSVYGISEQLQDLLWKLTEKNQEKRLGYNLGVEQIKSHEWFKDICWKKNVSDKFYINTKKIKKTNISQQEWKNNFEILEKYQISQYFIQLCDWNLTIRNL